MNKDARIFIKENVTENGNTVISKGDYKGKADLSLTRSSDCFKSIFWKAGYETIVYEKWHANEKSYPILTASLRLVDLKPRIRHTSCIGSKDPSEWPALVPKQEQEQQEEVKMTASTDNAEESVIEVKVQDAEAKLKADHDEYVQIYVDEGKDYDTGLEVLRDGNVIIGEIVRAEKPVQTGRTTKKRTSAKKQLYSIVLNLNAQISHPTYRDMLKTIRILAHMLASTSRHAVKLQELMKELPHDEIRTHSQEMCRQFMHDKLRITFDNRMRPIM